MGFPDSAAGKEFACNAEDTGDTGLIPGSKRFPRWGNNNQLQYFLLKIPWTEEPGKLHSKGSQRVYTTHTNQMTGLILLGFPGEKHS